MTMKDLDLKISSVFRAVPTYNVNTPLFGKGSVKMT